MLHLLLGTDWVAVRNEILSRVAMDVQGQHSGRILMVPELISHDTERRLCATAGDTASRFAEVLSFPRLARRVADSVGCAAESCMDNGGRVVAMAAAARQLASRLKAARDLLRLCSHGFEIDVEPDLLAVGVSYKTTLELIHVNICDTVSNNCCSSISRKLDLTILVNNHCITADLSLILNHT